ncbi:hypothetical protein F0562_014186 [Nyssa sinensis]|uniref:DUF4220 domain-containing protein n=1 Tax=Nyssa sinensis TaxID=561372 RepID=A0A5J4ZPX1_9ASTE|nr:hypothetical protein F0562_014186 [Nyssa sinensis]
MTTTWVIMPLWSAYLLADWAANFAVGLISSSQGNDKSGHVNNSDLLAFWAPFLLVHLGGPDTITAFALEDNELWLRHLLGLIFQCAATLYVFIQTLPKNVLWIPTIPIFLAGVIKYSERTRALYLASLGSFRDSMLTEPDPGPNYARLMDEYFSKKKAKLPSRIVMIAEPDRVIKAANAVKEDDLTDLEVLQHAHRFFETFKGLVVDLIFSFRERNQSRDFFLKRTAKDAFRIVEVELNFIYDVLFTKIVVVHDKFGYFLRFISFSSVLASLVLFYKEKKWGFDWFDIGITYTLLLSAMALDAIAFLMLISSDWTSVALKNSEDKSFIISILSKLLVVDRKRWVDDSTEPRSCCLGLPMCVQHILNRRWSESISQHNLIYYCLHKRPKAQEKLIGYLGLATFLNERKYVKRESFTKELRDFIFEELLTKSQMADDLETAKEICAARGDWVLRIKGSNGNKYRDFSMLLSDYMLYLLVMQPTMMSKVAGIGQIRFRDTCAEANKFFRGEKLKREKTQACPNIATLKKFFGRGKLERDEMHKKACQSILDVNTEVKPVTVKGDRSKSVLFDASILAKELKEKHEEVKWEIMSRVWVELLSYAASHCRADSHAQQLSKGGELVTVVWLLMAHLGLGDQFQINEGHARAKLIVGK